MEDHKSPQSKNSATSSSARLIYTMNTVPASAASAASVVHQNSTTASNAIVSTATPANQVSFFGPSRNSFVIDDVVFLLDVYRSRQKHESKVIYTVVKWDTIKWPIIFSWFNPKKSSLKFFLDRMQQNHPLISNLIVSIL